MLLAPASCLVTNSGAGGNVSTGSYLHQKEALVVAKECLLAAVKADPRAASVWVNLANAYYMDGEHRNSKRCLEQVTTFVVSVSLLLTFITQISCHKHW